MGHGPMKEIDTLELIAAKRKGKVIKTKMPWKEYDLLDFLLNGLESGWEYVDRD